VHAAGETVYGRERRLKADRKPRSRKRKCQSTGQGAPCTSCQSLGLQCSIWTQEAEDPPHRSTVLPTEYTSPSNDSISNGSSLFVEDDLRNELVDLYFRLIHDKQHSLFHPPTFIASVRENKAAMVLVFAILSLAARFVRYLTTPFPDLKLIRFSSNPYFHDTEPWSRGHAWAKQSKLLFDSRLVPISVEALQACTLLLHIAFTEGDMENESLYAALAIRMVQRMELPTVLSHDRVEREVQIRRK
jgi:hypothetical protein